MCLRTESSLYMPTSIRPIRQQAIMIQFHTGGWSHRALWGNEAKINFGRTGTAEKLVMGPLPKTGEWVRLEVPVKKFGMKAGTKVGVCI